MPTDPLEPLYQPWDEPSRRREKNPSGGPAIVKPGRRPSRALLAPYIRGQVNDWRQAGYPGATPTTKTLLNYWFDTAHPSGFRYHFCQREAVETAIWLYEVAHYRRLSDMIGSLLPEDAQSYASLVAGVTEEEDAWARYCSKVATGGGKTKCMSLMVAWSYFNSLYEDAALYPRHFVLIAPNLIVFDRLLDDFTGPKNIFYKDPVLPPEFADGFNLEVVQQDEAGGGSYTGTVYVTNIHRLFERASRAAAQVPPSWAGPDVKRAQVFKVGEKLRSRITEHPGIMVLNDEAHHLHDPDSAWNEAIVALNDQSRTKGNNGVQIQLDFTATPKHNDGSLFRHIASDFPLGEAVDAGIVKVPVIGISDDLKQVSSAPDAFEEYRNHLILGYQQYEAAFEEWQAMHKPILFVMTENAAKANEIAVRLNDDDRFPLLKGRVLNLHTRLKGKIVNRKIGGQSFKEFVPNETGISDDDLRVLRDLSKKLDLPDSPYRCVVSVLMLREGWDVRNVTTIIPLRPYSADSNILAEQTLGRGLRRMTPPGDAFERVTVVEHEAFTKLYTEELAQEGLDILVEQLGASKPQTVSIFVDHKNKPVEDLEIEFPCVSDAIETTATIAELTFGDLKAQFTGRGYARLPIGKLGSTTIRYEERTLFTDEVVRRVELDRGLLQLGSTAIGFFVRDLEKACRLQGATSVLAPLVQQFIEEVLFERKVAIYSGEVDHRMGDPDVAEHIRATFAPVIRAKTVRQEIRKRLSAAVRLSTWSNFQATRSGRKPCVPADRTMFNLVACDRGFEETLADFIDHCDDVAAFAKNAGPQKLTIDYLATSGRPALYWPDFFVRLKNGSYYLLEAKGAEERESASKARAAVQWCEAASTTGTPWNYLYLTMPVFEQNSEFSLSALARASQPKLKSLLKSLATTQAVLPFDQTPEETRKEKADAFLAGIDIGKLPDPVRVCVEQAINQLAYDKQMGNRLFSPAFQILLEPFDALCGTLLIQELSPRIPQSYDERRYYFEPYLAGLPDRVANELRKHQYSIRKNLIDRARNNRIGCLMFCLRIAVDPTFGNVSAGCVWDDVRKAFSRPDIQRASPVLNDMNNLRNRSVAHVEEPITDANFAEANLATWVKGLAELCAMID